MADSEHPEREHASHDDLSRRIGEVEKQTGKQWEAIRQFESTLARIDERTIAIQESLKGLCDADGNPKPSRSSANNVTWQMVGGIRLIAFCVMLAAISGGMGALASMISGG